MEGFSVPKRVLPFFGLEFFGDGFGFRRRIEIEYREISKNRHYEEKYREEAGRRFDVDGISLELEDVHPGDEEKSPDERHDRGIKREPNPKSHTEER